MKRPIPLNPPGGVRLFEGYNNPYPSYLPVWVCVPVSFTTLSTCLPFSFLIILIMPLPYAAVTVNYCTHMLSSLLTYGILANTTCLTPIYT